MTITPAKKVNKVVGASALPFLQANQMRLSTQISEIQYEEARLAFRQTLWRALSEVELALSARAQLAAQGQELESSLAAAVTAERLYEVRYRAGAASLRNWLDAQERRRQAELALEQNRYDQRANLVSLYLSLGGDAEGGARGQVKAARASGWSNIASPCEPEGFKRGFGSSRR